MDDKLKLKIFILTEPGGQSTIVCTATANLLPLLDEDEGYQWVLLGEANPAIKPGILGGFVPRTTMEKIMARLFGG